MYLYEPSCLFWKPLPLKLRKVKYNETLLFENQGNDTNECARCPCNIAISQLNFEFLPLAMHLMAECVTVGRLKKGKFLVFLSNGMYMYLCINIQLILNAPCPIVGPYLRAYYVCIYYKKRKSISASEFFQRTCAK